MAYFAELDENNIVLRVTVVHENDAPNGAMFCHNLLGGNWIETFDSGSARKQYAGIGFTYNADADVFVAPQPFSSWSLDGSHDWQAPTPKPDGSFYWDEESLSWLPIPDAG